MSFLRTSQFSIVPALATWIWVLAPLGATAQTGYRIQERDTLLISVANQPDLSQKYVVGIDGAVTLPLVGRVPVVGQTAQEAAADLQRRLAQYLRAPRVSVEIERMKRVFVFGEIKSPGTYPLTEHMTLLEALVQAGYTGPSEVIVVRPALPGIPAPLDGSAGSEVIRISMADLERDLTGGDLSRNVLLKDADTVFVPRADPGRVFVSGEVRKPGAYPVAEGTTVLQVLTLAGGATAAAALKRVRIARLVDGELRAVRVSRDDVVRGGDTVTVPESVLFPFVLARAMQSASAQGLKLRIGDSLLVTPAFALRQLGIDRNPLNRSEFDGGGEINPDFTAAFGPAVDVLFDLSYLRLRTGATVDFNYFSRHASERSVNRTLDIGAEVVPVAPVTFFGGWRQTHTRERYSAEVDPRAWRLDETRGAGARVNLSQRFSVELAGEDRENGLEDQLVYRGVNLRDTLTEQVRSATATVRYALTPLTTLALMGGVARHRFPFYAAKNADASEVSVGVSFKPFALVSGEAGAGYLRYLAFDPSARDFRGVTASAELEVAITERTILGVSGGRNVGNSFQPQFPYAVIEGYGGSIRRILSRRFDVLFEGSREVYRYEPSLAGQQRTLPEAVRAYSAQLGVHLGSGARLAFGAVQAKRLAPASPDREYEGLRFGMDFTYGIFQVRGR